MREDQIRQAIINLFCKWIIGDLTEDEYKTLANAALKEYGTHTKSTQA